MSFYCRKNKITKTCFFFFEFSKTFRLLRIIINVNSIPHDFSADSSQETSF